MTDDMAERIDRVIAHTEAWEHELVTRAHAVVSTYRQVERLNVELDALEARRTELHAAITTANEAYELARGELDEYLT